MSTTPSPGAVIFAKSVPRLADFYARLLAMAVVQTADDHTRLQSPAMQLVIHAIPASIANSIRITEPPAVRKDMPIKPVFPVASLAQARQDAVRLGGSLAAPEREWSMAGFRACDGFDPEGNVFQLREPAAPMPADDAPRPGVLYAAPVLPVAGLAPSLAWYRDVAGFDVEFVHQSSYASVVRDGCRIHLKQATPSPRDQAAFEAAGHVDVCIGVRDVSALAADIATRGAALAIPMREMPYGREFYLRDPDGYILGFVQAREHG